MGGAPAATDQANQRRTMKISNLAAVSAAVSGDPALHSSLRCSRSFGASDLVAPNGRSPKGRINMKKEKKRWRARVNQPYYVIDLDGSIERMREDGYIADTDVWEFGNYFKTRKDAERARRKIGKVLRNL